MQLLTMTGLLFLIMFYMMVVCGIFAHLIMEEPIQFKLILKDTFKLALGFTITMIPLLALFIYTAE